MYKAIDTDYNSIYNDRRGAPCSWWLSFHTFLSKMVLISPQVPPGQIGGLGWWVWGSRDTPKKQIPFISESQQSKPPRPKRPII